MERTPESPQGRGLGSVLSRFLSRTRLLSAEVGEAEPRKPKSPCFIPFIVGDSTTGLLRRSAGPRYDTVTETTVLPTGEARNSYIVSNLVLDRSALVA